MEMANSLDRHPLQRSDPQFCQTLVAGLFGDRLNAIGSDVFNATFGWLYSWPEIMPTSAMRKVRWHFEPVQAERPSR